MNAKTRLPIRKAGGLINASLFSGKIIDVWRFVFTLDQSSVIVCQIMRSITKIPMDTLSSTLDPVEPGLQNFS